MFSGYTGVGGMDPDRSPKQHFPQADPPLPAAHQRGTRNHLTRSHHQQHLSAAGDHAQTLLTGFAAAHGLVGSFCDRRTNALIWMYKKLHKI